jgi:hypothetical protein
MCWLWIANLAIYYCINTLKLTFELEVPSIKLAAIKIKKAQVECEALSWFMLSVRLLSVNPNWGSCKKRTTTTAMITNRRREMHAVISRNMFSYSSHSSRLHCQPPRNVYTLFWFLGLFDLYRRLRILRTTSRRHGMKSPFSAFRMS